MRQEVDDALLRLICRDGEIAADVLHEVRDLIAGHLASGGVTERDHMGFQLGKGDECVVVRADDATQRGRIVHAVKEGQDAAPAVNKR